MTTAETPSTTVAKKPTTPQKVLEPRRNPAAKWVALLISVALVGLAVVAGRELVVILDEKSGYQSWVHPVLELVGNARYQAWMFPAGIAAVLVGLIFLYIAFKPRKKTHHQIVAEIPLYMRTIDLVRMCTAAAEQVPGVHKASSFVSKNKVTVTIQGDSTDPTLIERVTEAVSPLCQRIASTPTLKIQLGRSRSQS